MKRTGTGSAADPYVCTSGGTTGVWNAASGQSAGYEPWRVDLSGFPNQQVEVSITLISDWSVGEIPGILVDDVTVRRGATVETESFESGMGAWTVPGAPEGSFNGNDWVRTQTGLPGGRRSRRHAIRCSSGSVSRASPALRTVRT